MDIQTLSKVREIIGDEIAKYISNNVGKLHTAPHKEVLAFSQNLMSSVTISLQKDVVKPEPVSTKKVRKSTQVVQKQVKEDVADTSLIDVLATPKKRGRPSAVKNVEVDSKLANASSSAVIKKVAKKKKLANKILEANGISHEKDELEISEPEIGFADTDSGEEEDFTF